MVYKISILVSGTGKNIQISGCAKLNPPKNFQTSASKSARKLMRISYIKVPAIKDFLVRVFQENYWCILYIICIMSYESKIVFVTFFVASISDGIHQNRRTCIAILEIPTRVDRTSLPWLISGQEQGRIYSIIGKKSIVLIGGCCSWLFFI